MTSPTPHNTPNTPNTPNTDAAAPASCADLAGWIGRSETLHDSITPKPVTALAATLDHPVAAVRPGDVLPPLWHWLYFLPTHPQSEVGPDGHPRRGGFLPPVPLPRRMWAGSQFEFFSPLRVGDALSRSSTIEDVSTKHGRSGTLVFVKVRHAVFCNGSAEPALVEFQDIVYRAAQQPGDVAPPPQAAAAGARWQREVVPDAVLLFRYSALTFNGHRIHYDRPYATGVEGYPGLVVHGPLIATLLLDLLRRELPGAEVASFRFKAVRPTFDLNSFRVSADVLDAPEAAAAPSPGASSAALARPGGGRVGGKTVHLWAQDHEGWLTMDASATLR